MSAVQRGQHLASRANTPLSRQDLVDALARVSDGDRQAFQLVYAETSAKLYGIIIRLVGRPDLADDIMQEVYLRVWERAPAFDPACGSPITWLAPIARNRALDEAKRKTTRSLDDCPEVLELENDDDPLADHEQNEERRRLQTCLDRLGAEKRDVILQVYYYGMTREEIASRIGRPVATVKTWLRRGLAELKGCLGE